MTKSIIVSSLAICLIGGPVVATVTSSPAIAQEAQAGVLSQAAAVQFANKLGKTLPEAIKEGYLRPAEVPGTYVVTEDGARAAGVPIPPGGLSPLQITALVAGVIGLTVVIIDFIDDDDDDGRGPTQTTPSPTPTPTGGGGTTTTTTTTTTTVVTPTMPSPSGTPTMPPIPTPPPTQPGGGSGTTATGGSGGSTTNPGSSTK